MTLITLTAPLLSNQEWTGDPDLVEIYFEPLSIPMIEATQEFMKHHHLNKVEQFWAAGYEFFEGDTPNKQVFEPEYRVEGCTLVVYVDRIKFKFPFKHTDEVAWTDESWTVEQLKELACG